MQIVDGAELSITFSWSIGSNPNCSSTSGTVIRVEWLKRANLPFQRCHHLYNPWNENRKVQIARDGQELEPSVGEGLVRLWDDLPTLTGVVIPVLYRRYTGFIPALYRRYTGVIPASLYRRYTGVIRDARVVIPVLYRRYTGFYHVFIM